MASLKEIKSRIQSVKSTQKITSAMKMVSSAKLRKAQKTIENFFPYEQRLNGLLNSFLSSDTESTTVFAEVRDVKRVAIVVFASNSSLCGGYNSNVVKRLSQTLEQYRQLGHEHILVFPVGKKVAKACHKMGFEPHANFESMADKPTYAEALDFCQSVRRRQILGLGDVSVDTALKIELDLWASRVRPEALLDGQRPGKTASTARSRKTPSASDKG